MVLHFWRTNIQIRHMGDTKVKFFVCLGLWRFVLRQQIASAGVRICPAIVLALFVGTYSVARAETVAAPATRLGPGSKELSKSGAHTQRCRIEAAVRFPGTLWIEDLVEHLEAAASYPVFAVLKRPDEKHVTAKAFENPKFVEDIVRDLAIRLEGDERITWFAISSENFESIHSHNAYAELTRDKRE